MESDTKHIYDVIIIGGGPGGVSAALYTVRGGLDTAIIHDGRSALSRTSVIQNYYGIGEADGKKLCESELLRVCRLGCKVFAEQVVSIEYTDGLFCVFTPNKVKYARRLVLATGAPRKNADIPGVDMYIGKGISDCAICDGFFYKNKNVALIGGGEYAKHEYGVLKAICKKVYVLTDGVCDFQADNVISEKISGIKGDGKRATTVLFETGTTLDVDGIFIAKGVLGSAEIAKRIGILTDKSGAIATDETGMTNVPDLYAVGDCAVGIKQMAKAVYDGMRAAIAICEKARR